MNTALEIGIVGHTNTGKTSLIRTLLRNSQFGEVRNEAGTTRHVERATLPVNASHAIDFRDTPGLEDSSALKDYLLELQSQGFDNRAGLQECIERGDRTPEFEQEIKVLKQSLQCQLLLYVIDCREPVFQKYSDEIEVLRLAAVPILPVLNFIHSNSSSIEKWRKKLAEQGLHAHVAFDTVAYDFDAEKRLYQKLQTLLESDYDLLQTLIEKREHDWQQLISTCSLSVAHLLLDVCKIQIPQTQSSEEAKQRLQDSVRRREQTTLKTILQVMQFNQHDVAMTQLPVNDGHWQLDLFSAETLKTLGLDTASAAATGAAVGVGIDLLFAGMSLGAATATGATLGAAWHTGRRYGKNLLNKLSGKKTLVVDNTTLDSVLLRQLWLLNTIFHRGHAAAEPSRLSLSPNTTPPPAWAKWRETLRTSAIGLNLTEEEAVTKCAHWLSAYLVTTKTTPARK